MEERPDCTVAEKRFKEMEKKENPRTIWHERGL